MQRRRSTVVCLGLTAVLATALTGCGADDGQASGDPEYTGICVDKTTGVRLDDSVCENDPLPDEKDFQATSAVNAGSDPAIAPPTSGTTTGATTSESPTGATTGSPTGPSGATPTTDASTAPTTGSSTATTSEASPTGLTTAPTGAASSTAAPIPSCAPIVTAGPTAATVTATLPAEASPTSATAPPTTFEGACPPGQTPAGPGGTPAPVTTTVYRHSTSHGWFFIPWGLWSPPIGARATYGSYAPPTGTTYSRGGVTRSGGTVSKSSVSGGKVSTSRGGFGGSGSKGGS